MISYLGWATSPLRRDEVMKDRITPKRHAADEPRSYALVIEVADE